MSDYDKVGQAHTKPSRIEADIERVKLMNERVRGVTERITHHCHTLGYFGQSKEAPPSTNNTPQPVVTSLTDAIAELQLSIERLDGSLTLFH